MYISFFIFLFVDFIIYLPYHRLFALEGKRFSLWQVNFHQPTVFRGPHETR